LERIILAIGRFLCVSPGFIKRHSGASNDQEAHSVKANYLKELRLLCDGMMGHNFELPDCLKLICERLGVYEWRDFWNVSAFMGDACTPVYNRKLTTFLRLLRIGIYGK
jgi:hypothetical protein